MTTVPNAPAAFLTDEAVDLGGLRWLAAGDQFCLLELADHMDLAGNMRAIQLADRIVADGIDGVAETLPMFVSVLVHYDPAAVSLDVLRDRIGGIWRELSGEEDVVLPSRILEIPVCYLDPWTKACVEDYARTIKPIGDDPTFVAEANGLPSAEDFVRRHAFTEHWVGGVGFWPGLPDMLPLDPRCQHSVTKYDPPRLTTVPGAIGVGGGFTSIYPMNTPGGYHLIGRTPVPIFSLDPRLPLFRERPTLFQPGDRVRFRRIDAETFVDVEAAAAAGDDVVSISAGGSFSLREHRAWSAAVSVEVLP